MSLPVPAPVAPESPVAAAGWRLEHTYSQLPAVLHTAVAPTLVRAPRLVVLNDALARQLGLDPDLLTGDAAAAVFAGNQLPPGAAPLAQAYAGHQYGSFTPLGDGRALLLGEQVTPSGQRFDVQLKGAGPTPFSRRGDGRAALGPMLREYIISEAMHALGIPTTRSLAVAATGEQVLRERALPGAVLTRIAASHIRVGTFEWVAALRDEAALRELVSYTLRRHYPERSGADQPALVLLESVIERQAALIAQWMLVGFVHGVMNTDNMALSGETIDYGPCAFLDAYDPGTVFSSIDAHGRYAYGNQPAIAGWNLARLAETLIPLIDVVEDKAVAKATAAVEGFAARFLHHWHAGLRRKLGLCNEERDDKALFDQLFKWMHRTHADFTNTFATLTPDAATAGTCAVDEEFREWHQAWKARLERQPQGRVEVQALRRRHNPLFIPRNHQVEAALAAAGQGDLGVMERLLVVLRRPYEENRDAAEYQLPDPQGGAGYQTFCGT